MRHLRGVRALSVFNKVKLSANPAERANIIILGAPGGGKGTISNKLIKDFSFLHVSTGDMLRRNIAAGTPIGAAARALIAVGELMPDELMIELIDEFVKMFIEPVDPGEGLQYEELAYPSLLLDGFPRTVEQAKMINTYEWPKKHPLNCMKEDDGVLVISLDIPHEVIVERMKQRWIHMKSGRTYSYDYNPPKKKGFDDVTGEALEQREDDKPDVVLKRLKTYDKMTKPLISHYRLSLNNKNNVKVFSGSESDVIYPLVKKFVQDHLDRKAV